MRRVIKPDLALTDKLLSDSVAEALKAICATKDKSLISANIYRQPYDSPDGKRSRVEDLFAVSYDNKCAYCECRCKADIEHYRPAKAVSGIEHDGYYWLCYEWSNLIPACITCNREGGKHNHFPILGDRVFTPAVTADGKLDLAKFKAQVWPLIDEKPYLLHPEIDNPDDFFEFEIDSEHKGIRIKGVDAAGRGEKTIEICKLNRQELLLDRKDAVIDDFLEGVRGAFKNFGDDEDELLNRLEEAVALLKDKSVDDTKTHTLLRQYIVSSIANFNQIMMPFLRPKARTLVSLIIHL